MPVQGQTTAGGGTHIRGGHAHEAHGWYQRLRDRCAVYTAARREAHLAALRARWDPKPEAGTPWRADAALDMAAAHVLAVPPMLDGLSQ